MFDMEFTPKITREYLLSKNTEETYMAHYLGIPVIKGLFISPLRADNHKTCAYFRGKSGNLYFKDFATGQCLTFEGVVMAKYNCNYREALDIIAKDFGYIKGNSPPKVIKVQPKFESEKQTFIQCELKDFTESELKWWNSFGVTKDILKKFNIHSCKTVFLNGRIFAQSTQHAPIYGYYFGKKENIEQWRLYFPKNQNNGYKFLGNVSVKTIQGYKQLPKSGKLLVITKSMKDVCAMYSFGITAIAPNSEHVFISDKMLEELKSRFDRIIVLYDTDIAGLSNMQKIRKEHPELEYLFIPRKYDCKDFSDLVHKLGREKVKELIKEFVKSNGKKSID